MARLPVALPVAAAVLVFVPGAGAGDVPAGLGRIAVVEKAADAYDTPSDIVVVNGDGSGIQRLTENVDDDSRSPRWAPDGRRLAFDSGDVAPATSAVHLMDADGTVRRLTREQRGFDGSVRGWSSNGRWIVYADNRHRGLSLVATDGSDRVKAAPYGGGEYSPDGRWLAQQRSDGLYVISLRTGRARLVARRRGHPVAPPPKGLWSPDSRLLLAVDPDGGMRVVRVDGRNVRRLPIAAQGGADWSPDSRWIALANYGSRTHGIYVVRADGTGSRRITSDDNDAGPTWSPDGARIAFIHEFELWIMNRDGGDAWRVLARRPTIAGETSAFVSPTWSPR